MFEQSRVSLEDYVVALRQRHLTPRGDHLLQEIRARVRHLQWLYTRLLEIERELQAEGLKSLAEGHPKPDVLKQVFHETPAVNVNPAMHANCPFNKSDELRVLLEAFYYSAHRVRDILQDHGPDLPGVGGFEAKGVRDVRNHLVEHPSGKHGVIMYSTACGGPVGPQLRLLQWSLDPPGTHDQGLHHNAKEFNDALERCLSRAVVALSSTSIGPAA